MLSSIMNSWATLVKRRPAYVEYVIQILMSWTPIKFEGSSASVVRSAEKSVRILLTHISRCVLSFANHSPALSSTIVELRKDSRSKGESRPLW